MEPGMQSMNNTGREVFVHPPGANIKSVRVKNNTRHKLIHKSPAYFKPPLINDYSSTLKLVKQPACRCYEKHLTTDN